VVVVLMTGRPLVLGSVASAPTLLADWLPGSQGGTALADILRGETGPSGRLPISVPRNVGQIPVHHDHRAGGGRSQMLGDYSDAPTSPLYSFGHGCTYTSFAYDGLAVGAGSTSDPIVVSCDVTNTGTRDGVEVVQCYLRDEVARCARPRMQLAGFARVTLAPGATQRVRFTIDPTQLAYYDEDMRLVIEPGAVRCMVGASVGDVRLHASVMIEGPEREIAPNDRRPATADLA
jgi:beta-glucosidase